MSVPDIAYRGIATHTMSAPHIAQHHLSHATCLLLLGPSSSFLPLLLLLALLLTGILHVTLTLLFLLLLLLLARLPQQFLSLFPSPLLPSPISVPRTAYHLTLSPDRIFVLHVAEQGGSARDLFDKLLVLPLLPPLLLPRLRTGSGA
eukprot:2814116-Rhodomonas_salina.1